MTTGKEMCELISKFLKETKGGDIAPKDIWESSQTGELYHVFELYEEAKEYYESKDTPE